VFDPAAMMQPAWGEFAQRLARVPGLAARATWQIVRGRPRMAALEQLASAMPAGLLDSERIHHELERVFSAPGRSNDFRRLRHKLVLVATDLDSGEAAPFGQPGFDHVPISRAVQASAALPGLFPPVEIEGRCYVDGALKKTLHASVLLEEGLDLLICLNPLVPFDTARHPVPHDRHAAKGIPRLVEGGLPVVLSQTFRSMIHSRLELGLKRYEHTHPGTDIVLFEPDHRDARMFLANTFSYSQRRELAEHAYQSTRTLLRRQHDTLAPKLARHGIGIDRTVLYDTTRELVATEVDRLVRSGRALQRLDEVLGELERRLHRS
jgi:predicted acylesterase/phospholipase RssA